MFTIKNAKYALTHNKSWRHLEENDGRKLLNAEDFFADWLKAKNAYFADVEKDFHLLAKLVKRYDRDGFLEVALIPPNWNVVESQRIFRPDDVVPLSFPGAVATSKFRILGGQKEISTRRVTLQLESLEEIRSSDGSELALIGSKHTVEMDLPEGWDFDPLPRSVISPTVIFGDEQSASEAS
jgi:hypothetical protein